MNNPIFAFSAIRRMRSARTPLLVTLYSLLMLPAVMAGATSTSMPNCSMTMYA